MYTAHRRGYRFTVGFNAQDEKSARIAKKLGDRRRLRAYGRAPRIERVAGVVLANI
jgi:hypothetical protein